MKLISRALASRKSKKKKNANESGSISKHPSVSDVKTRKPSSSRSSVYIVRPSEIVLSALSSIAIVSVGAHCINAENNLKNALKDKENALKDKENALKDKENASKENASKENASKENASDEDTATKGASEEVASEEGASKNSSVKK